MHSSSSLAGLFSPWLGCLLLALVLTSTSWGVDDTSISTQPVNTSVAVGDQAIFSCAAAFDAGGDSCVWYRNNVVFTGGTATKETPSNIWKLTLVAAAGDQGARFHCVIHGSLKGHVGDATSNDATLTIVPGTTVFALLTPAPATTITADVTLNPPGILFTASRPVQLWEVNYPNTDAVFRSFGNSATAGATASVLPLTLVPTTNTPLKIRVTSFTNQVYTGTYTLAAQQLPPVNLATATFSSPYYFAFAGVSFAVDASHGLGRFTRDPNGEALTYSKVSGANLTIASDGSFTWTPPAVPAGTIFPGTNIQNQQIVAGTYTATDGHSAAIGPFDLKVTVYANPGDVNRDGVVNIDDVQAILARFGQNPGIPTTP